MIRHLNFIHANWPVPDTVKAFTTTRYGGVSQTSYASLNLATHVNDNPSDVITNRQILQSAIGKDKHLMWLQQTHSDILLNGNQYQSVVEADASITDKSNQVCVVMTADCLPILLSNRLGTKVAALHCGWKGLLQGLISKTIREFDSPNEVIAWLGPAISPRHYEVDLSLYTKFTQANRLYQTAFTANRPNHYLCDLYTIARIELQQLGINAVYGGDYCTYADPQFFSYRENIQTGRIASLIYIE